MKKVLSVLLSVVFVLSCLSVTVSVFTSGACGGNISWKLDSDGLLTISGTDDMPDFAGSYEQWLNYKLSVKKVNIAYGITSIGNMAFYHCANITDINIPDTVTRVGSWPFRACRSLVSIDLPDGITSIDSGAFRDCDNLESIRQPEKLEAVSSSLFWDCASLKRFEISACVKAKYPDFNEISGWAREAAVWALDKGVISGMSGKFVAPLESAKAIGTNVSEITTVEGLLHFEYEFKNTEDGETYHCHTFTFKAGNAFRMTQFMTYKENEAALYPNFVEWAKSVRF